ncbi:MAG: hypothetical protein IJ064_06395 [Bacteroidaceae bacterium]|nr:hypothetical protein [Bacteroidaceae bacterium]
MKILPLYGVEIFTGTDGSNLHVHGCGFTFATATALTFEGVRHWKLNGGLRSGCGFKMTGNRFGLQHRKRRGIIIGRNGCFGKEYWWKTGGSDDAREPARLSR